MPLSIRTDGKHTWVSSQKSSIESSKSKSGLPITSNDSTARWDSGSLGWSENHSPFPRNWNIISALSSISSVTTTLRKHYMYSTTHKWTCSEKHEYLHILIGNMSQPEFLESRWERSEGMQDTDNALLNPISRYTISWLDRDRCTACVPLNRCKIWVDWCFELFHSHSKAMKINRPRRSTWTTTESPTLRWVTISRRLVRFLIGARFIE